MKKIYTYAYLLLAVLFLSNRSAIAQTTTFNYTASVQTYAVPAGVTSIVVDVIGAQGGGRECVLTNYQSRGGCGGRVQATINVTPGHVLNIYAGGGGVGGSNTVTGGAGGWGGPYNGGSDFSWSTIWPGAGGGAGSAIVDVTSGLQLAVAGGGGGGGGLFCQTYIFGNGIGDRGGNGGGLIGAAGNSDNCGITFGGQGGTQLAGGAASTCIVGGGTAGSAGTGGSYTGFDGSGGGGGGYYGGGAGTDGAGGGGGSSYTNPTFTTAVIHTQGYICTTGVTGANGKVIITVSCNAGTISGPTAVCAGSNITLTDAVAGGAWSSGAAGVASVSASGVVTGNSAGTATISYTVGGCSATYVVTVTSLPTAILGNRVICSGTSGTLSDAVAGGVWSSSNPAVASIVAATGVVTGLGTVTATATISYTIGGSCFTTAIVTVNPSPAGISGTPAVCAGLTTTLTDASAGGTWSSSNPGIGSIGAASGIVSGIVAGTTTISYTNSFNCSSTVLFTVNPSPVAITGAPALCVGQVTTMSDATTGGTWQSSNTAVATIVSATGFTQAVGQGTTTITYTLPAGCTSTMVLTVNPLPAPITGNATVCGGVSDTLYDTTPGGVWSSSNTGVAIIGSGTGIAVGIVGGTATISYVLPATGCGISMVLTVNTSPIAISGNHSLCVGLSTLLTDVTLGGTWSSSNPAVATIVSGSGLATGVSNGTSTITYLLSTGCTAITEVTVNPVPGTINGSTNGCIGFTTTLTDATPGGTWSSSAPGIASIGSSTGVANALSAGNTTMTYALVSTGCYSTMLFTVNPPPAVIIGSSYICAGSSSIYNDASPGGTWSSSNSAIVSIGSSSGVAVGNTTGTADITYTLASTTCYRTLAITVTTPPTPVSGSGTVCNSYTTTLSDGTPGGIWSTTAGSGSVSVGSTSGIVTGLSTGTAIVSYTTFACPQVFRVITINPLPAPITGPGSVCAGSTVTLSDITPGGTWSATGATVSSTGVVTGLTVSVPASVTYTLPTGCYQQVPVSVSPVPDTIRGTDTVCPGSFVILTDLTPGGVWSSSDGTVAEAIAMTGQVNGLTAGTVTLSYTLVSGCAATMSFRVLTPLPAWLKVSTSPLDSALCHNTPVTLSTTDSNAGAPTFVWKLFGTIYMGTGPTLTYNPQHGDFITVTMTTHSVCASPAVIAKDVVLNVWPEVGPIVDISCTQADTISYIGEVYTFYSVVTYGGPAPLYQWYINNVVVAGANAPVFTTHIYNDNDTIYCKVTGNSPCDTGSFIGYSNTKVVHGLGFLSVGKVAGAANDLTLFPNPNNGAFVLNGTVGNSTDNEVTLEVVDMLGRTVYTGTATPQNGKLHAEIKLNAEASGNYLLRIHTESVNETFHFVVGK